MMELLYFAIPLVGVVGFAGGLWLGREHLLFGPVPKRVKDKVLAGHHLLEPTEKLADEAAASSRVFGT